MAKKPSTAPADRIAATETATPDPAAAIAETASAVPETLADETDFVEKVEALGQEITEQNYEAALLAMLPESERDLPGAVLFAEACVTYGVDPTPGKKPAEILHDPNAPRWRFYRGDEFVHPPVPHRVRFVTAGGVKICHPIDQDFEAILRRWLRAWHIDPQTHEYVEDPLPPDLTLPREAITGIPTRVEHRRPGGYLRQRAIQAARATARR